MLRLRGEDEGFGRIRLSLMRDQSVIGVASVSQHEYVETWKKMLSFAREIARKAILDHLGEMLWHDAQSGSDLSVEAAKERLIDFGWTNLKIEQYADALAREIAKKLAEEMPGR